jgi:hypothetical protein
MKQATQFTKQNLSVSPECRALSHSSPPKSAPQIGERGANVCVSPSRAKPSRKRMASIICAYRHLPLLPPSAAAAATTASLRSHSVQRPSSHPLRPRDGCDDDDDDGRTSSPPSSWPGYVAFRECAATAAVGVARIRHRRRLLDRHPRHRHLLMRTHGHHQHHHLLLRRRRRPYPRSASDSASAYPHRSIRANAAPDSVEEAPTSAGDRRKSSAAAAAERARSWPISEAAVDEEIRQSADRTGCCSCGDARRSPRDADETSRDESTDAAAVAAAAARMGAIALGKKDKRACEIAADAAVASVASSTTRASEQSCGDVVAVEEEASRRKKGMGGG